MFQVETYQNPDEYFSSINFNSDDVHLTSVSALSVLLQRKAQEQGVIANIHTCERLLNLLYPKWNQPLNQVYLASEVRKYLSKMKHVPQNILNSMEKSVEDIVLSFRFAAELGVNYFSVDNASVTAETVFKKIYNQLISDQYIRQIINDVRVFKLEHLHKILKLRSIKTIYVYQLSQVPAPLMLFFHKCKMSGIKIIFRIPFYPEHQSISAAWKELYQNITQKPYQEWQLCGNVEITKGIRFINFLEGKENLLNEPDGLKLNLQLFATPIHFKRFLLNNNLPERGKRQYVAPVADLLNQAMRDVIKTDRGLSPVENSILHYPIGKFLVFIYQCKKKDNRIYLDINVFTECITSGWVVSKGVSGKRALSLLRDLEPYMDGTETIEDIKDRLLKLQELIDVGSIFDNLAKEQTQRNRTKKYLTNPFRAFPYVHKKRYDITIKQLLNLTEELEKILYTILPEEGEQILVRFHLSGLAHIWNQVKAYNALPGWIVAKLNNALSFSLPEDWEATRHELKHYLAILLSSSNENKIKATAKEQEIHDIGQLDGLILDTEELHITGLSIKSLQKTSNKNNTNQVYLTHTLLNNTLRQQYNDNTYKMLCHCLFVDYSYQQYSESFLKFNIFYTLSFFSGRSLTLSWINELYEHDDESFYIKVLTSLYHNNTKDDSKKYMGEEDDLTYEQVAAGNELAKEDSYQFNIKLPAVSWLDLDFCPLKFFYSSLLNSHPIYESDFHQRMVFGVVGSLLANQANGEQDVMTYLFPLFPQWPNTLKDNMIRTNYKNRLRDYFQYENINYPKAMNSIQLLRSKYYVTKNYKIKNAYYREETKEKAWQAEFVKNIDEYEINAFTGRHCSMCPHQLLCKEGEFAVDRRSNSGNRLYG